MHVYDCNGELYVAVVLEDDRGYDTWKLQIDSAVYHVTQRGCTCPSPHRPCKHMLALFRSLA